MAIPSLSQSTLDPYSIIHTAVIDELARHDLKARDALMRQAVQQHYSIDVGHCQKTARPDTPGISPIVTFQILATALDLRSTRSINLLRYAIESVIDGLNVPGIGEIKLLEARSPELIEETKQHTAQLTFGVTLSTKAYRPPVSTVIESFVFEPVLIEDAIVGV